MNLWKMTEAVSNRQEFCRFVVELLKQYEEADEANREKEWGQNTDLPSYLEAVSSAAYAIRNIYENQDEPFSETATWRLFAEILYVATDYE